MTEERRGQSSESPETPAERPSGSNRRRSRFASLPAPAILDGDGNLFVVDEHAERKWLPDRHAAAIKAMLARHGLSPDRLRRLVATKPRVIVQRRLRGL